MADPRFITTDKIIELITTAPTAKINAIKTVRTITGLGLKEAKDFVEQDLIPVLLGTKVIEPPNKYDDEVEQLKTRLNALEKFVFNKWKEE